MTNTITRRQFMHDGATYLVANYGVRTEDQSERRMALIHLAGTGSTTQFPTSGRVCLFIHGMNNPVEQMTLPAELAVDHGLCESAYGVMYPWWKQVEQNGRDLRTLLRRIPATQKLIVVAHSLGGVVARYAIEQDDSDTDNVSSRIATLVLLGVPNQGTKIARVSKLWQAILGQTDYRLILPLARQLDPDSPEGKALFGQLNGRVVNRLCRYPIFAFAGKNSISWELGLGGNLAVNNYPGKDCDGLVSAESALSVPSDANFGRQSCGQSNVLAANHSELIQKPNIVAQWLAMVQHDQSKAGPIMTISPEPLRDGEPALGWRYEVHFANHAHYACTITEWGMRTFDRSGNELMRQWHNNATDQKQIFPQDRTGCHYVVPAHGAMQVPFFALYDRQRHNYSAAPSQLRAKTVEMYCAGRLANGITVESRIAFTLTDPADPRLTPPRNAHV